MHAAVLVGLLAMEAAAFPAVLDHVLSERQVPSTPAAVALSKSRTNCGPAPCLVFSPTEQFVSTTGDNAWASPAADEIRGPCPGLNAAANHGYLPRSGIADIENTITGLGTAYGMSVDLAGFLAAYAIITDGDPVAGTWSIGGPLPSDPLTKGLLGPGQGISFSHNVYENDASIARGDAFINNGNAYSLQVPRFVSAYMAQSTPNRYSLDMFAQNYQTKVFESIGDNPYAFWAPFSGLVAPAAYNFVINFMSNHSAAEPSGYLDGSIFKSFFAITGTSPNFKWLPGQERIPDNWYRRTSTNQYSVAEVFGDLGIQFLAYPDSFRLGGNTGKVNSYEGVDLSNLTGGVFNSNNILDTKGVGLRCFVAQFMEAVIFNAADTLVAELASITSLVNKYISPVTGGLDCPVVDEFSQSLFNKYPGHSYSPTGGDNNGN